MKNRIIKPFTHVTKAPIRVLGPDQVFVRWFRDGSIHAIMSFESPVRLVQVCVRPVPSDVDEFVSEMLRWQRECASILTGENDVEQLVAEMQFGGYPLSI